MGSEPNLRSLVSGALVVAGYVQADRMHRRQIRPGVWSIVDTGPLGRRRDIAPWVGLRHEQVEETVTRWMELPNAPWVPTVAANVGYVVSGTYRSWSGDEGVESVLREIDAAQRILAPFAELARLSDAWTIRGTELPGYQYRLAVVHSLLGNQSETERWLREAERVECRVENEVCEQFKRFKANLLANSASKA